MKGLVLELRDGLAAVLREDGQVVTTAMACQVGETIELPAEVVPFAAGGKKAAQSVWGRWAKGLVAAVLALAVVGGGYSYNTAFACSYVSVDAAEASLELAVNRRGQVIDVQAMDEDSAVLAQELSGDLRRMPLDQALDVTMDRLDDRGFLADGGEPVIIGVTADSEKREAELDAAVEKARQGNFPALPVYTVDVTPEERQDAALQHQSGGRYAYEKENPPQTEGKETQSPASSSEQTGTSATAPSAGTGQNGAAAPAQSGSIQSSITPPVQSSSNNRRPGTQAAQPAGDQSGGQSGAAARDQSPAPAQAESQDVNGGEQEAVPPDVSGEEQAPAAQDAAAPGQPDQDPDAAAQSPAAQDAPAEAAADNQEPGTAGLSGGNGQGFPADTEPASPLPTQPEEGNESVPPAQP